MTEALEKALDEAMPALYGHCVNAYKAMLDRSEQDSETGVIVYEGFAVRLITEQLSLSSPYFSHCTRALKEMGCIKMIRRGGGRSPSLWHLIKEPTPALFNKQVPDENKTSTDSIKKGLDKHSALEKRVDQLQGKVIELADMVSKQQSLLVKLAIKFEEHLKKDE